nr:MAG TPA: hypothetical protein [Caudoviricetes sp.]
MGCFFCKILIYSLDAILRSVNILIILVYPKLVIPLGYAENYADPINFELSLIIKQLQINKC